MSAENNSLTQSRAFKKAFKTYLSDYVTPHKKEKIKEILGHRTRHFTVVLEDIYKPHNASAVLRTADCFGVQDVHVIEKSREYHINPYVTRGAAQWVDLHKYYNPSGSSVQDCLSSLKNQGYKIVGTSPEKGSIPIQELNPKDKTALVFGNEHAGISDEVKENCDALVHIPMMGFSESFNISVAAAICLYELTSRIQNTNHSNYWLSDEDKGEIEYCWFRDIVKNVEAHEAKFLKSWEE